MDLQWFLNNPQYSTAILIIISIVVVILSYTITAHWTKEQLLPGYDIHFWTIMRALTYLAWGVLYPGQYAAIISFDVSYKLIESLILEENKRMNICPPVDNIPLSGMKKIICNRNFISPLLWYWPDVLWNIVAYSAGSYLRCR